MLELEEKAAAATQAADLERERSLRLEENLHKMNEHLSAYKRESAANKLAADKAVKESTATLDSCRKGIKAVTQRVFGKFLLFALA